MSEHIYTVKIDHEKKEFWLIQDYHGQIRKTKLLKWQWKKLGFHLGW